MTSCLLVSPLRRLVRAVGLLALVACGPLAHAALNVVACEPEWAALAKELGGDRVNVSSATTAQQDPHRVEARPSLIARMRNADLVVYDPKYRGAISAKTHQMATDYSAFEGWEIKGRPSVVTVRGEVMARDGKFVGAMGKGKLVPR